MSEKPVNSNNIQLSMTVITNVIEVNILCVCVCVCTFTLTLHTTCIVLHVNIMRVCSSFHYVAT